MNRGWWGRVLLIVFVIFYVGAIADETLTIDRDVALLISAFAGGLSALLGWSDHG